MHAFSQLARLGLLAGSLLSLVQAAPSYVAPIQEQEQVQARASSGTDRLVFCHFMMGIISDRTSASDYDADMQRAKALGIDAFALNIGTDSFTDTQLGYAYESAAKNGMKVFISFDFNWFSTSDGAKVGKMIAQYGSKAAQLKVGGKIFASSFSGDGVDVSAIRSAAGTDIFFAPNFAPGKTASAGAIDGALNWMGWSSNGANKAPDARGNVSVADGDASYQKWLGSKSYIAPVSAWFSTHYGPEVSYSKNFVFPSDLLWYQRWNEILALGPQYLEIITWNDFGESHYIGPLGSQHGDDGNSKWANDMPHDGWLDMAKPFIAAYKDGAKSVESYVKKDQLIYWYRPTLRTINCDATDTTVGASNANNASGNFFEGRPYGWQDMEDAVFVVSLLTQKGSVTVTSGSNKAVTFDAPAGAFATMVPMAVGKQTFELKRGGSSVASATSLRDVSNVCPCGIYNFNAYVGVVPPEPWTGLPADGLKALTSGLKVTTCKPTPSINGAAGAAGSAAATSPAESAANSPATTAKAPASASPSPSAATSATSAQTPTAAASSAAAPASSASAGTTENISSDTSNCSAGTVASGQSDNFSGLCSFACAHGYCPDGVCKCTATGTPVASTADGTKGCPAAGLDDSYLGLCSFNCARGYCPEGACTTTGC